MYVAALNLFAGRTLAFTSKVSLFQFSVSKIPPQDCIFTFGSRSAMTRETERFIGLHTNSLGFLVFPLHMNCFDQCCIFFLGLMEKQNNDVVFFFILECLC